MPGLTYFVYPSSPHQVYINLWFSKAEQQKPPVGLQLGLEYLNVLNKDFLNSAVGVEITKNSLEITKNSLELTRISLELTKNSQELTKNSQKSRRTH